MNNIIKFIFLLLCVLITSQSAYAVCQSTPVLVYGNGIFNTKAEARRSVKKLKEKLTIHSPTLQLEYQLAYADDRGANINSLGGILSGTGQLLEVFVQKMGDSTSYFWRILGGVDIAPAWFQTTMKDLAAQTNYGAFATDPNFRSHLQDIYRPILNEGRKLLIISHSQGNFYANAAYDVLTTENPAWSVSIGNVAVATPASFVASGGAYVTAVEDLIIEAILAGSVAATMGGVPIPIPLWPYATNPGDGTSRDMLGHNFIRHYLAGNTTRPLILNHIAATLQGLQNPVPTFQAGAISVTMTWANATDMDLHVFEPTGHVFYRRMRGAAGFLDVDNTRGYGPEHYYVACNTLQAGAYSVGVNYYSGNARPEIVTVQIKAGPMTKTFTQSLGFPRWSGGNNSPTPVAKVTVTNNPNGGFDFAVQ